MSANKKAAKKPRAKAMDGERQNQQQQQQDSEENEQSQQANGDDREQQDSAGKAPGNGDASQAQNAPAPPPLPSVSGNPAAPQATVAGELASTEPLDHEQEFLLILAAIMFSKPTLHALPDAYQHAKNLVAMAQADALTAKQKGLAPY